MTGPTENEKNAAIAAGPPGTAFAFALAELSLYWDNHPGGRPEPGNPVINLRARSDQEVAAVARWLGVEMHFRNGTWFAQRRFGSGDDGTILVEAHFTPDHDAAHAARLAAKEAAGQRIAEPALAGAA